MRQLCVFQKVWKILLLILKKINLEQIKANDKFHGKNSGFVDSGFVKTCDELVIGHANRIAIVRRNGGFITSKNTKNATRIVVIILIGDFSSLFFSFEFFCEITRIVHLSCKILNNIHWHLDPRTKRLKNCITILVKETHIDMI